METFTSITQAETTRKQRAYRFESLTTQRDNLKVKIAQLEQALDTKALEKIHSLIGSVNPDLVTNGVGTMTISVSGGLKVRDVLMTVVSGALNRAAQKETERKTRLDKVRAELVAVEKELASFVE